MRHQVRIRAIIVDLDNTIFPATAIPASVLRPAIDALYRANVGPDALDAESLELVASDCWRESFDRVAIKHHLPARFSDAWADASARLHIDTPLSPYDDIDHLWRLSLRRFMVTTGYTRFQREKIAALRVEELFEAVYIDALDDPLGARGKRDIFKRILAKHAISAREVVVVGDSAESEIAAGHSLGMPTIQVLRDGMSRATNATLHIGGFAEIDGAIRLIETSYGSHR